MKANIKQFLKTNAAGIPQKQGLYDPAFEHDSCGIGFVVRIDGEPSYTIVENGIQVLVNLISNGLEALTRDDQTVTVSTSAPGEASNVELTVSDQGEGMNDEQLNKAFEPFYSSKLESGGTGLGLTITKMLVDEHGASMNILSSPGEGTEVRIIFPIEHRVQVH